MLAKLAGRAGCKQFQLALDEGSRLADEIVPPAVQPVGKTVILRLAQPFDLTFEIAHSHLLQDAPRVEACLSGQDDTGDGHGLAGALHLRRQGRLVVRQQHLREFPLVVGGGAGAASTAQPIVLSLAGRGISALSLAGAGLTVPLPSIR